MEHLYLFQIGPVQTFIAAGRRTQDLYVGSRLLSDLAAAGVQAALAHNAIMLFPFAAPNQPLPRSVPHRFAFICTSDQPQAIAADIRQAVYARWQLHANQVKQWLVNQVRHDSWVTAFDRQVANWLEFYWVAVEYDERKKTHGETYRDADRAMAARKAARHFPAIHEPDWKCTLTGASSALPLGGDGSNRRATQEAWGKLSDRFGEILVRPNEMLGAVATVKRFMDNAYRGASNRPAFLDDLERFPSTRDIAGIGEEDPATGEKLVDAYFAVLHMDGDKMGEKLSHLKTVGDHQRFSQILADFSDVDVANIVRGYDGNFNIDPNGARARLIYAGGDDVLALLPLRAVLDCANTIRVQYEKRLSEILDGPTMSAGIAVTPENYPLDSALEIARGAEHQAKEGHGRNAVVVTEAHGTAMRRSAGAKWQINEADGIAGLVTDLMVDFTKATQTISTKLGYDLQELAYALDTAIIPPLAREDEARRLLTRRMSTFIADPAVVKARAAALSERLSFWGEHPDVGWEGLANWVILARFLASGGRLSV